MRTWRTIEKDCPICHGLGQVSDSKWIDGECWTSFYDCPCVEVHHDDEMKAFLNKFNERREAAAHN